MKIISKYKDYYDFLSGIYGEDPLIILDRRDFSMPDIQKNELSKNEGKIQLFIGGYVIDGYYNDGKIYYGEELKQFEHKTKSNYYKWFKYNDSNESEVYIKIGGDRHGGCYFSTTPIKDHTNTNDKENCPIVLIQRNQSQIFKNCILKDLYLNTFINPVDVYRMISDWISLQRTKNEIRPDTLTNIQKIESKGFDKITSFRGK